VSPEGANFNILKLVLGGAASAVLDDAVLDVGDAWRLDRAHLLDLEVADVLEQPLAVPEQDRDEAQLELVD
jgi:TraM recognition site of TraD and TraG